MNYKAKILASIAIPCALSVLSHAQDISNLTNFDIDGRPVQIHGFVQQGFAYSDNNNYLTMDTSHGSFAMTDAGLNISSRITENLRVGAQVYDRILGDLNRGQLELDWAMVDYQFRPWLGIRGGKVKTTLGLFNDTQDMEFLRTFALLPSSMYPIDQRNNLIAHIGGDLYGDIPLKTLGTLSYTVYGGRRPNAPQEGFRYAMEGMGIYLDSWSGWMEGADLRWATPVKGLLAGASYMSQADTGSGYCGSICLWAYNQPAWEIQKPKHDETSQYYAQYVLGNLEINGEYRRRYRILDNTDWLDYSHVGIGPYSPASDTRSWYESVSYRINKRLSVGAYDSKVFVDWPTHEQAMRQMLPDPTSNHIFDRAVTVRFDLTSSWNLKVEGHFMNGYGSTDQARGFYPQDNPGTNLTATGGPNPIFTGLVPHTNMLVVRTGWNF